MDDGDTIPMITARGDPGGPHFNGTTWRQVATPTIDNGGRLTGVVALSPSNIIAVGTTRGGGTSLVLART